MFLLPGTVAVIGQAPAGAPAQNVALHHSQQLLKVAVTGGEQMDWKGALQD
jgi:hypothetical protein